MMNVSQGPARRDLLISLTPVAWPVAWPEADPAQILGRVGCPQTAREAGTYSVHKNWRGARILSCAPHMCIVKPHEFADPADNILVPTTVSVFPLWISRQ